MSDDDIEMMLAFKRGDYNAFSVLVERHQRSLLQYFYSHAVDLQQAEDCAQEVWKKLFRWRQKYEPKAQFKTFLFRIARNHWIDTFRTGKKRGGDVSIDDELRESEDASPGRLHVTAIDERDPTEDLERRELQVSIESALARLPIAHREVFVLAEVQGMRYEEIADLLEIPIGTVKSRMFNAVRKLRELLKKEFSRDASPGENEIEP